MQSNKQISFVSISKVKRRNSNRNHLNVLIISFLCILLYILAATSAYLVLARGCAPWTPTSIASHSPPTNPLPDPGIKVPNLGVNFKLLY